MQKRDKLTLQIFTGAMISLNFCSGAHPWFPKGRGNRKGGKMEPQRPMASHNMGFGFVICKEITAIIEKDGFIPIVKTTMRLPSSLHPVHITLQDIYS